jgi:hypothetical protein
MNDDALLRRLTFLFLVAHAAVFLAFGLGFLLFTEGLAQRLDIHLRSATALADLRAMYGGMSLGVGLLFVLAIARPAYVRAALFTVAATSIGLLAARLGTMLTHPDPVGPAIHGFSIMEAASAAGAVWLLARPSEVSGRLGWISGITPR